MYTALIENTHLAAGIIFLLAVAYLFLGLVSPSLAGAAGRGSVTLRSILGVFVAVGLYVGVIAYTHSQPDGPHSLQGYINDFDWEKYRAESGDAANAPAPEQPVQQQN